MMNFSGRLIIRIASITAFSFLFSVSASAGMSNLREVKVIGKNRVELIFDLPISNSAVTADYLKDAINLNIKSSAIYPAKIQIVDDSEITRVFAYQYSSNQVRARVSFKEGSIDLKQKSRVQVLGKRVVFMFEGGGPVANQGEIVKQVLIPVAKVEDARQDEESQDKRVLTKITEKGVPEKTVEKTVPTLGGKPGSLQVGNKAPVINAGKSLASILLVFTLLVGTMIFIRKKKGQGGYRGVSLPGIDKLFKGVGKPIRRDPFSIEVVSTQSLGPKKSITVVRISGQTMVLGVTDESIQLISRVSDDGKWSESAGEEIGSFDLLLKQAGDSKKNAPIIDPARSEPPPGMAARDRILKRLGEMKSV